MPYSHSRILAWIRIRSLIWSICLVAGAFTLSSGQPDAVPTVTFTCDFPGSEPSHYGVSVSSNGHTSYISDGKLTQDSEPGVPFTVDLNISDSTVSRIFALTKESNYFEKNIDLKKKKMAFTGDKTLTYVDERRNTTANYGYSPLPAVQELTTLFQRLSATIEFGHRLEYQYRYQKLALDEELKHMEDASTQGGLVELAAAAPILQKIIQDPSVMNTVRARAQRLLEHASAPK